MPTEGEPKTAMTTGATRLCKKCAFVFPIEETVCPSCGRDQAVRTVRRTELSEFERFKHYLRRRRRYILYAGAGLVFGVLLPVLASWIPSLFNTGVTHTSHVRAPTIADIMAPVLRFIADNAWAFILGGLGAIGGGVLAYREQRAQRAERRRGRGRSRESA